MAESIEPQRLSIGLIAPTKLILRPEVDQQQEPRVGHLLNQQIEESLALVVQPMQILNDQHQGFSRGFGQQDADHSLECARAPELRIHGGETKLVVLDLKERVKIGERRLERLIEVADPLGDLLPAARGLVALHDAKIAVQQLDHRQI